MGLGLAILISGSSVLTVGCGSSEDIESEESKATEEEVFEDTTSEEVKENYEKMQEEIEEKRKKAANNVEKYRQKVESAAIEYANKMNEEHGSVLEGETFQLYLNGLGELETPEDLSSFENDALSDIYKEAFMKTINIISEEEVKPKGSIQSLDEFEEE